MIQRQVYFDDDTMEEINLFAREHGLRSDAAAIRTLTMTALRWKSIIDKKAMRAMLKEQRVERLNFS